MRIRTDSWWEAGRKRAVMAGAVPNPLDEPEHNWSADWLEFLRTPGNEALPGDVWILRSPAPGSDEQGTMSWGPAHDHWPIVGYGLVCPLETCDAGVHLWDHAYDCDGRYDIAKCKQDNGALGCWRWTGGPDDDTLTGEPSLHVMAERGGCGWHGYLRNGQMVV